MTKPKLFNQGELPENGLPAGTITVQPDRSDPRSVVFDAEHPDIARDSNSDASPDDGISEIDGNISGGADEYNFRESVRKSKERRQEAEDDRQNRHKIRRNIALGASVIFLAAGAGILEVAANQDPSQNVSQTPRAKIGLHQGSNPSVLKSGGKESKVTKTP